jgi:hypothetical protein
LWWNEYVTALNGFVIPVSVLVWGFLCFKAFLKNGIIAEIYLPLKHWFAYLVSVSATKVGSLSYKVQIQGLRRSKNVCLRM